tara:strand:+ start:612 stop:872 length:261 start_codon:yes stop_codon:yes gene_type:complete
MKIFFYKSVLVFVLFILAIHFSFGLISNKLKNEYKNLISKERVEHIKNKIRIELKNGVKKDDLINPKDAKIINKFLEKIKTDLEKN